MCERKPELDEIVFPWKWRHWPEMHVYWNYEMEAEILDIINGKAYQYTLRLNVDSTHDRARQDYYGSTVNIEGKQPTQSVIGDYKYALIYDLFNDAEYDHQECNATRFDESMNTIRNIIDEIYFPRDDSYSISFGIQCLETGQKSHYGFRSLASDDKIWYVFFDAETKLPELAFSSTQDQDTSVHIKKGKYKPRKYPYKSDIFFPQVCKETKNIFTQEGPIIPLADFTFLM
ncbi:UNKNOWN [Stylonychia lemnae]|uniref:Uncharacterized protein n=1 Tax=Stylonychia lemnae TaxID=5949 RepID=A0A078APG0_STYLE|nr:UNKNOWN [Stylonychia lemnae]|eukprot:CDW84029.1 UNKNOWN [Stylonychia lemnae]